MRKHCLQAFWSVFPLLYVTLIVPGKVAAMTYDNDGTVNLQWQANSESDLAGYNVYRGNQRDGPYAKLNATTLSATAFADTQVTDGATYYYVLTAVDEVGNESAYSPRSEGCRVDMTAPTVWASLIGGSYYGAQIVELGSSEQGTIYCTTDGTAPSTSSQVYGSALILAEDTVLTFVAVDMAGNASDVQTEEYTFPDLSADTDGDGMPDVYEVRRQFDPFDEADAAADSDGDGYSNLEEHELGTEPTDAEDHPTPPWVVADMLRPHGGQGLTAGTLRVPVDTSVMVMLEDEEGVSPDSIVVNINAEDVAHTIHEVIAGDPRELWVVYDSLGTFQYDEVLTVTIEASDVNGYPMTPYAYSFKTETIEEHQMAADGAPLVNMEINAEQGLTRIHGEEGTVLEGVIVTYTNDEMVPPRLGPSDEIAPMDDPRMLDILLNIEPTSYYEVPVTILVPASEVLDISCLRVYYYHPLLGWVRASEGDGWLVAGSRTDYVSESAKEMEFQVAYAAPMQFLDASPPPDPYDINRDDLLDRDDLHYLLNIAGSGTLTEEQIELGDLNADGTVDMRDVKIMLDELRERRHAAKE